MRKITINNSKLNWKLDLNKVHGGCLFNCIVSVKAVQQPASKNYSLVGCSTCSSFQKSLLFKCVLILGFYVCSKNLNANLQEHYFSTVR